MTQRGFTLLETLVALTVLALSFGIFLQAFSSNLRVGNASARALAASQLAETLIARAGSELALDGLDAAGSQDSLVWRLRAREAMPAPGESPLPRVFEVSATIAWSDGGPGRQRDLTITTFKLEQAR